MNGQPDGRELVVITHVEDVDISWVRELLDLHGRRWGTVEPCSGDTLPDPVDVSGVIILGGPYSAYQEDEFPFLAEEAKFLRRAVEADIPVLAICLGSQILAQALGGKAVPGTNGLECGFIDVRPAAGYEKDPTAALAGRYFSFHTDTFELPPDAELLAVSDRYPQAWRAGSALALQFHPEIAPSGVRQLLGFEETKLRQYGVDVDAIIAEAETNRATAWEGAKRIIGGWLTVSSTHTGRSSDP